MKKLSQILGSLLAILLIAGCTFYGGYYLGKRGFVIELKKNPPEITVENKEPQPQRIDFSLFWTVWDLVNEKHIDRPLDGKKLFYGAISGMVKAIDDDYTGYFPPVQNQIIRSDLKGEYQGIGAW